MPVQLDIAGNFAKGQRVRENRQFERAMDYELDKEELTRQGAWRSRNERSRRMGRGTEAYEEVEPTNVNWLQKFARAFSGKEASRASPYNPAGFGDPERDAAAAKVAGREAMAAEVTPEAPADIESAQPAEVFSENEMFRQDGGYVGQRGRAIPPTSPSANVFRAGGQVNRYGGNVNAPYRDGGYVPPPSNVSARLGHRGRGYQAGGPVVPGISGGMIAGRPGGLAPALSGEPGLVPTAVPQLGGGFPQPQTPGYAARGYQDGGLHAIHPARERNASPYIPDAPPTPQMGQRGQRTAIASAGVVPQEYREGGLAHSPARATPAPGYQAGGTVSELGTPYTDAQRAAYERARLASGPGGTTPAQTAGQTQHLSPAQIAEQGTSKWGRRARAVGRGAMRYGAAGAALGTIAEVNPFESLGGGYTDTSEYRRRLGLSDYTPHEGLLGAGSDALVRGIGVMGDIGNRLTGGLAGEYGESLAEPDAPEAVPSEPQTPEDEITAVAIPAGIEQAAEAEVENAPPGDFDFSKSDIQLHEIPEMSVNDWMNYRSEAVIGLMEQGMTGQQAHESVNLEQQQGTLNYLAQAQQALAVGDRRSASLALYAAYQHFPNGTSLKFGTASGRDGEQVLLATGIDQESGDPIGQPTAITQESLAALRANIEDPTNFLAWTKDWRDEQFQRKIYEEVEKPAAESRAQYETDIGEARGVEAAAEYAYRTRRGAGGRTQADEDKANAYFDKKMETLAFDNPQDARALASVMSQLYVQQGKEYTETYREVMDAYEGTTGGAIGLDGVADYLEQYE